MVRIRCPLRITKSTVDLQILNARMLKLYSGLHRTTDLIIQLLKVETKAQFHFYSSQETLAQQA